MPPHDYDARFAGHIRFDIYANRSAIWHETATGIGAEQAITVEQRGGSAARAGTQKPCCRYWKFCCVRRTSDAVYYRDPMAAGGSRLGLLNGDDADSIMLRAYPNPTICLLTNVPKRR